MPSILMFLLCVVFVVVVVITLVMLSVGIKKVENIGIKILLILLMSYLIVVLVIIPLFGWHPLFKNTQISFLGFSYKGPIILIPLYIIIGDVIKVVINYLRIFYYGFALKKSVKKIYSRNTDSSEKSEEARYILIRYLRKIEDMLVIGHESYRIHCFLRKVEDISKTSFIQESYDDWKEWITKENVIFFF